MDPIVPSTAPAVALQSTPTASAISLLLASVASVTADQVRQKVVDTLTTAELDKRSTAVLKGLELFKEAQKENAKASKPDVQQFDIKGVVTSSSYSKPAAEAAKKAGEKLTKIENALNKAIESADFSKLYELTNSGKSGGGAAPAAADAGSSES